MTTQSELDRWNALNLKARCEYLRSQGSVIPPVRLYYRGRWIPSNPPREAVLDALADLELATAKVARLQMRLEVTLSELAEALTEIERLKREQRRAQRD